VELPYPSLNVNMTEMNEGTACSASWTKTTPGAVDALSRVDVFRALDAQR